MEELLKYLAAQGTGQTKLDLVKKLMESSAGLAEFMEAAEAQLPLVTFLKVQTFVAYKQAEIPLAISNADGHIVTSERTADPKYDEQEVAPQEAVATEQEAPKEQVKQEAKHVPSHSHESKKTHKK